MKTFDDLVFKKHKIIGTEGIQSTLEVRPNILLSVVAGTGMYSTSKAGVKKAAKSVNEVSTFEAAYKDENLAVKDQEWIVLGWQTREDITNLISKLCSEN
tara:strand:+ start:282 stop:581 length:300 start_codon:yes stop_codon:yes gene_type:complete